MIILGIHDGHCASACLSMDGRIVSLVAEERFTRVKNDSGYPLHAIEFCLENAGVSTAELDMIAVASTTMNGFYNFVKAHALFGNNDWIKIQEEYWKPKLYENRENPEVFETFLTDQRFKNLDHWYDYSTFKNSYQSICDPDNIRAMRVNGIRSHLKVAEDVIRFYDHHTCHAYYGIFASGMRDENTLIYTLDGGGDGTVTTLSRFADGKIEEINRSNNANVARIYREITLMMGMKLGEHEYKVMGLAPYATDREAEKSWSVFDGMMGVHDDLIAYNPGKGPKDLYFHFRNAFEGHRFDGIAAAVQRMTEESVIDWVTATQKKYKATKAVFAGGVAMNVKLNMLLADIDGMVDFYVPPSPTDDTLCAGACYIAEAQHNGVDGLHPIDNPYVGPENSPQSIETAIKNWDAKKNFDISSNTTAAQMGKFLADGKVIARCAGPMEFGARALGNRSILADARNKDVVTKINSQIKYRDFWMPFAPVVLEERAGEYLDIENTPNNRQYMMIAAKTTPSGRKALAGAIHGADGTARPQVLSRDQNPDYYDIIKAFENETGTGALLNTSFNLHGEPIVCTPEDALRTFERSELDVLMLNDTLVSRQNSKTQQ